MKRIAFSKMKLLVLLFSLAIISVSCGSDDPEPIVVVDTDGDGVADADDACPSEAGLAALGGCPDADGDGVADKDDTCPNEAGLVDLGGCPDADGDGIADKDDACPNEAGVAALDGCPEDAVESTEELGPNILRINSGGPEVTTVDGSFWAADEQYGGGSFAAYSAEAYVSEIADTDLDIIYLTETITTNEDNDGPFSYNIPVSNGTYTVKLHFAEVYWGVPNAFDDEGGAGSRIFDVDMEETSILNDFDLFTVAGGPAIAITKMYDIEVMDGELNIIFTSTVDKPKVSAIEVFGEGTINP